MRIGDRIQMGKKKYRLSILLVIRIAHLWNNEEQKEARSAPTF
ncbi:MAG: hypothetical protein WB815_10375 [Nitrososphaeraceae archaeon]